MNPLKIFENCFIAQNMIYLGKYDLPSDMKRMCIPRLLGRVFCKYQLGQGS